MMKRRCLVRCTDLKPNFFWWKEERVGRGKCGIGRRSGHIGKLIPMLRPCPSVGTTMPPRHLSIWWMECDCNEMQSTDWASPCSPRRVWGCGKVLPPQDYTGRRPPSRGRLVTKDESGESTCLMESSVSGTMEPQVQLGKQEGQPWCSMQRLPQQQQQHQHVCHVDEV